MSAPDAARPRGWRWMLAGIFALALALRLVCVAQYEAQHPLAQRPVIDEASYERWALAIAGGDWLGDEVFFQEPLYPYWLGAVYAVAGDTLAEQRHAARVAQSVLGALTAVLLALLGARVFGPTAGLAAGAMLALHRPAIWMASLLLKPNLFLPVLALLALVLLRTRRAQGRARAACWLAAGVLVGLGALLRGNMLVLAPCFVLWPLARALLERRPSRGAVAPAAAVLLGVALVLLPVALRNRAVGGVLALTTSGAGTNLYGGNNLDNPYGIATEFPWVRGVPEHEAGDWRREAERRLGRELDMAQTSDYWRDQVLESARRRPLAHLRILWNKLRVTLGSYEVPDNHFLEWDARYVPLLRAPLPGFALWGSLGLAGLFWWLARARRGEPGRGPAWELAALFALYLGTIVLTVTSERVRLALVPLLLPFGAWWLAAPWGAPRAWLPRLASLALAAALVLWPALPEAKRAGDLDERDHNLVVGLLDDPSQRERAEALVDALLARHPRSPRLLLLRADLDHRAARILRQGGDLQAAEVRYQRALDTLADVAGRGVPRERFQANALAGAILQHLGAWERAAGAYRAARAFDPDDRDVRRRLAVVLAEQAMTALPGEARRAGLAEAAALLEALLAEQREAELEPLLARIREQM